MNCGIERISAEEGGEMLVGISAEGEMLRVGGMFLGLFFEIF